MGEGEGDGEGESEDPIYRIICLKNTDYSVAIRGGVVVFALTNPCDRYQHWFKDEKHGATVKDSEGQPAFAMVNRATGQAMGHCGNSIPVPVVRYDVNSLDKSVLWTMSKNVNDGFSHIRRADHIPLLWTAVGLAVYDGHIIDLHDPQGSGVDGGFYWKIEKVLPYTCISLFRPSQHTIKIKCEARVGYNLAIDKDGSTVLLVPSNPKDKYQHWSKETACGIPVKDEEGQEAFALVNKATGKAIKHGFGNDYLVQVAKFNRNYMDPSLLWTESNHVGNSFRQIRLQNNISLAFSIFERGVPNYTLLGTQRTGNSATQQWKIEDFE